MFLSNDSNVCLYTKHVELDSDVIQWRITERITYWYLWKDKDSLVALYFISKSITQSIKTIEITWLDDG